MKNKFFMRIQSLLTVAMLMLGTFSSCSGEKKAEESASDSGKNTEGSAFNVCTLDNKEHFYRLSEGNSPEGIGRISELTSVRDGNIFMRTIKETGKSGFYVFDSELSMFNEIKANLSFEGEENPDETLKFICGESNSFYCIRSIAVHDGAVPDYDDESFDYDEYMSNAEYTYKIYLYNADGFPEKECELTGIKADEGCCYVRSAVFLGDGRLAVIFEGASEKCFIISDEGDVEGIIEAGGEYIFDGFATDGNGRAFSLINGRESSIIRELDGDSAGFGDYSSELPDGMSGLLMNGTGEYMLFLRTNSGIYGLNEDNSMEELVDWVSSGISVGTVRSAAALPNGNFSVAIGEGTEPLLMLLSEYDAGEISGLQEITVAVFEDLYELPGIAADFNRSSVKYRVKLRDYSLEVSGENELEIRRNALEELKMDIISGDAPDIVFTHDAVSLGVLSHHGAFADLYEFMAEDEALTKEKFLPNILEACEAEDGCLYYMSPCFSLKTLAAKKKFTDIESCTFEELETLYNELPEDMELFKNANNKIAVFAQTSDISHFIDYNSGKCSFNSPEFIRKLEFCAEFPDTEDDLGLMADAEETGFRCRDDKALADEIFIRDFRDYNREKVGNFGEDITLLGYPSEDGQGALLSLGFTSAILENSDCRDGAWEFFKMFYTDFYQLNTVSAMPVIDDCFEKLADRCMENPYYIDESLGGIIVEYEDKYSVGGTNITIPVGNISREDRDFLSSYIRKVTRLSTSTYNSGEYEIYSSEINKYFSGEQSAQTTADMIQNRMSIFLSEQT